MFFGTSIILYFQNNQRTIPILGMGFSWVQLNTHGNKDLFSRLPRVRMDLLVFIKQSSSNYDNDNEKIMITIMMMIIIIKVILLLLIIMMMMVII